MMERDMAELLVKFAADGLVIVVVLVGAGILLLKAPKTRRLETYSVVLMAGLTAYLVATLIASIYQPEASRPFQQLGVSAGAAFLNNPGFPSDHTLFCMSITLAVWFGTKMKRVSLCLLLMTIIVALGRVVALVHTPLDVIGGIVIAFAGVPWYIALEQVYKMTGTGKKRNKPVEY